MNVRSFFDEKGCFNFLALGLACSLLLGPTVSAAANDPVEFSAGTQVTAQDIAQFDARWMGNAAARISDSDWLMKNRQAWGAWGIGDDATAMVRLFELTRDPKYLNHLRSIAEITLKYRDDNHPGDADIFPAGDNPDCMKCQPPFIDQERGGVMAAWGSGLYRDYVGDGGLTPVGAVISGVYAYPIAAFARIVAEDPSLQGVYGADAMKFANAGIQTMGAFASQLDSWQVGSYVEGTLERPEVFPTPRQCTQAKKDAMDHLRLAYPLPLPKDLIKQIDDAGKTCNKKGDDAGEPWPYNQSGSLLISFIELWRALDSSFYRESPLRVTDAALTRALIPFVVARHQRYFVNRLQLVDNTAEGKRYRWNYNDDVPKSDIEDTSHGNLDMLYLSVARGSVDRLNAITAPSGEPIPLDAAHARRFANTFLEQIARPEDIDGGGNLRCNVDGKISCKGTLVSKAYYNVTTDGWVNLASVDPTVYRLVRDVVQRQSVQDGVQGQYELSIANHSALLANKRYSRQITNVDLTLWADSVPAASDPHGWVYAAQDVQNVTFRGTDGHVYELWRSASGTGYGNLSANAGAPRAVGDPKGYDFPALGTHNVVYRGTDGHLHVLWWTTGAVSHDDLTALSGAPKPAGNPFPYVSPPFGVQNVVYRGTDGHLHVLYWSTGAVGHDDLTRLSGAPAPAGDPFGYFINSQGLQNVVYRGVDGHLHGLYWGLGAVGHDDLTSASGAPGPAGDPTAYETPTGLQNVVYRGTDGRVHGLYWTTGAVGHDDLSNAVSGAPLPAGNPEAYFNAQDGTHHMLFRTSNGHLHELSFTTGAVAHADLSTLVPAPPSAGKPSAYVVTADRTQHVIYRAANGHLHDLSWGTPGGGVILSRAPKQ